MTKKQDFDCVYLFFLVDEPDLVEKICKLVVDLMVVVVEPMVPDLSIASKVVEVLHLEEQIVEKKEIVEV